MKEITKEEFSLLPKEVKEEFGDIFNGLSPENLSCDGELPRHLMMKRYKVLMRKLKAAERKVGKVVPESVFY